MATTTLSKADYLKRYVDNQLDDKTKLKKRKIKQKVLPSAGKNRLRIVDNEVTIAAPSLTNKAAFVEDSGSEEDEQPVVALVNDARPEELKLLGRFKTSSFQEIPTGSADKTKSSRLPRRQRHDSSDSDAGGSDASPPQQRRRHDSSDSDISVPRERRSPSPGTHDSDRQPGTGSHPSDKRGRRAKSKSPDSDLSPPRAGGAAGRGDSDSDLSPPRATDSRGAGGAPRRTALPAKTLDGKTAGLQSAQALRHEAEKLKQKEEKMFAKIDTDVSGRHAETVFRDRASGTRRDLKKERKLTEEEQQKRKELEDKYKKWNKGLSQLHDRERQLNEMAAEAEKPMARYRDDADLDAHLKQQELRDDPMLDYMRTKKHKLMKTTGKAYPKYQGPAPPPNRFGLAPGYRWDGVDRGNGFEQKCFNKTNLQKAQDEEFYKWQSGNYE